jgi:hypothetical protein
MYKCLFAQSLAGWNCDKGIWQPSISRQGRSGCARHKLLIVIQCGSHVDDISEASHFARSSSTGSWSYAVNPDVPRNATTNSVRLLVFRPDTYQVKEPASSLGRVFLKNSELNNGSKKHPAKVSLGELVIAGGDTTEGLYSLKEVLHQMPFAVGSFAVR